MNIKVNGVCKRAMIAYRNYFVFHAAYFPTPAFWNKALFTAYYLEYFTSQSEKRAMICDDHVQTRTWYSRLGGMNDATNCNLQYHTRIITNIHRKQEFASSA
jgi:hypothetical protein